MPELIDSHSHIDVAEFDADRATVLARARAAGVSRQIVPAIALAGFDKLRTLCRNEAGLYPAYGLHPMYLAEHRVEHFPMLETWIERERPIAVGECGLDFYVEGLDADAQRSYFRRQLEIAHDAGLPAILPARRALDEVIATLRSVGTVPGSCTVFPAARNRRGNCGNWDFASASVARSPTNARTVC